VISEILARGGLVVRLVDLALANSVFDLARRRGQSCANQKFIIAE